MSIRTQLEKKIENKKQEIIELENKTREAHAFLAGLQEALKVLPREALDEKKGGQILRQGSDISKARDYLRIAGQALHVNDILAGIGKEITKQNRISLGGSLGNYARRGEVFTKTDPNTFGLLEFDNAQAVTVLDDDLIEPPENFGRDT